MLRLADLLAEELFGLELLSGGEEAEAREVRGAHAVEVEAPARWLGRDWVMLTTGVRLRGNVEAQRELVPQLEAGGASAIGFGRPPGSVASRCSRCRTRRRSGRSSTSSTAR
jgi:purine catabolism regulator